MPIKPDEKKTTPQDFFEDSISILFYYGQLPVIALSFGTILIIDGFYNTLDSWWQIGVYFTATLSLLTSQAAITKKVKRSQPIAITLLSISLILTIVYLALLMCITSGHSSPFQHLYLYMPAVVFMVAQRRKWVEYLTSLGVLGSYIATYKPPTQWVAWTTFHNNNYLVYVIFEISMVAFLLILLSMVNTKMEILIRQEG